MWWFLCSSERVFCTKTFCTKNHLNSAWPCTELRSKFVFRYQCYRNNKLVTAILAVSFRLGLTTFQLNLEKLKNSRTGANDGTAGAIGTLETHVSCIINVISIQVTLKHWDPNAPARNHYRFVSNFIRNRYDWRCRLTCKLLTYQININRNKILWKSDFDRIGIRGINTKRAFIWYIEHCKLIWISQGWFRNWRERFFLPQTIWQPQKTLCSEINADMSKWISK